MRRSVMIGAAIALLIGLLGIAAVHQTIIASGWGGRDGVELGMPKDAGPPKPWPTPGSFGATKDLAKAKATTPAAPLKN